MIGHGLRILAVLVFMSAFSAAVGNAALPVKAQGLVPDSLHANQLVLSRMPSKDTASEAIVLYSEYLTIESPKYQAILSSIEEGVETMPGVGSVADPFISDNQQAVILSVAFTLSVQDALPAADEYLAVLKAAAGDQDEIRVMTIGDLSVTQATLAATRVDDPCGPEGNLALLPSEDLRNAVKVISQNFPAASNDGSEEPPTLSVVIDGSVVDPTVQNGIAKLIASLVGDIRVDQPTQTQDDAGDLTVITFPLWFDPCSTEAFDLVSQLRESTIPEAFEGDPAKVYVTGATAMSVDAQ